MGKPCNAIKDAAKRAEADVGRQAVAPVSHVSVLNKVDVTAFAADRLYEATCTSRRRRQADSTALAPEAPVSGSIAEVTRRASLRRPLDKGRPTSSLRRLCKVVTHSTPMAPKGLTFLTQDVAAVGSASKALVWAPETIVVLYRSVRPLGTAWLSLETRPIVSTLRPEAALADEAEDDVRRAETKGAVTEAAIGACEALSPNVARLPEMAAPRPRHRRRPAACKPALAVVDAAHILVDLVMRLAGQIPPLGPSKVKVDTVLQEYVAIAEVDVVPVGPALGHQAAARPHPCQRRLYTAGAVLWLLQVSKASPNGDDLAARLGLQDAQFRRAAPLGQGQQGTACST